MLPANVIEQAPLAGEIEVPPTLPPCSPLSALHSAPAHQKAVRPGSVEPAHVAVLSTWLQPTVTVLTLLVIMLLARKPPTTEYGALALTALLLARLVLSPLDLQCGGFGTQGRQPQLSRLLLQWSLVIGLLTIIGGSLKVSQFFSRGVLLAWFTVTPIATLLCEYTAVRLVRQRRSPVHRHIIIGVNEVGLELARRAAQSAGVGDFMGFFDFRCAERLPPSAQGRLMGHCTAVADFVRRQGVEAIYIALPIKNDARMEELLLALRDTTATVYFVPNIFAFDLVQARCVSVHGMPVFSIYDTPFHGMNAVRKRALDLAFAALGVLIAWPVMLAAALGVKLTSRGPVLFKQRRYGLNGEEILIYKFRSMTVCEDGAAITQASKDDSRITPVGRFLRATSLDELPQLFNVLEGKMSLVGPRPHAVAHNELYRKVISGYMLRHKVRPGMTGWAQVNGLRGETLTLEKMRTRVQYDLEYLQNWSVWLDIKILVMTAFTVLRDSNAY